MPFDGPFPGHRLQEVAGQPVTFRASPNRGGWMTPRYLVLHYTAGVDMASAVGHLCSPSSRVSAHLVIGRDGRVMQLVPFNRVAWHAGKSQWQGRSSLNRHSIGIELDNRGALERRGGVWRCWSGYPVAADEVIEARHKHEESLTGWQSYTPIQLATAIAVGRLLVEAYGLEDVIGHDDIAPGRKRDPGPALPLETLRAQMLNRPASLAPALRAAAALNIRSGPGLDHAPLRAALAPGTPLRVVDSRAPWQLVEALDPETAAPMTGWVHGDYLAAV